MSTTITASRIQLKPELLDQAVIAIGGSSGFGLDHDRRRIHRLTLVRISPRRSTGESPPTSFEPLPIRRVIEPADVADLAVHIMINTALAGGTYDIDGGQQFVDA